ncbi:hippocampus abundant transcript-like protein 1 isoform X2 [Phoenix dactylifera]|uniref:Hippocampus abundant transcript-like protein 1 isoform X2 n=1 Tax=Phoenix dactylifera TaxID=42345 RepID=A0A8B7C513_PHODC|nr:hippocampus abundant transcript-like protein 1 isoform X2 [Phoenix dactylifera]
MKELRELLHLFACAFLFYFSAFMVIPSIVDITMEALCPGRDQCSLAVYLGGVQQVITGLGTLIVTPLIGNLSDRYGRKALLALPMTTAIIPLAILAYDRSRAYFYAYYIIKMLTGMFCEGSMQCLSLAYVADKVGERRRATAFGVFSGVSAAGFVSGTLSSRFLSTSSTFQVSAIVAVIAAVYMRLFLVETDRGVAGGGGEEEASQPLCSTPSSDGESSPRLPALPKLPSLEDMIGLVRGSSTLSRAAVVVFFNSFAESGVQSALLYFLKAQFQFSKDQFADLLLIIGIAGAFSQLLLMHLLIPTLDEEKLLNIGLLASCAHLFLYSIAWSYWVPYLAAIFVVLSIFIQPCIRSIVSKKVGPNEQGMAQGCITGISSFASIISPFIFTPLTAWFLSEDAPFKFKGFSIMCAGFASLIAFVLSIMMRAAPPTTSQKLVNGIYVQA